MKPRITQIYYVVRDLSRTTMRHKCRTTIFRVYSIHFSGNKVLPAKAGTTNRDLTKLL